MRVRQHVLPLVLTVAAIVVTVAGATVSTGNAMPALVLEQGGHWVLDRAAAAVVHVHGGTRQVDAQVALPPDAAQDGVLAVGGDSEGYVVGRDRIWTFDRSTLTVVSAVPSVAPEVPVPVEVAGGPYLVYRQAGTVVRLGRPAVVTHAGGPLGPPVHTADGAVWVHRPGSGAICALRRDALDLDCSAQVPAGTPGGLTVTAAAATFVDTGADTARRMRGPALDAGAGLGADLPAGALLGDQDAGARLPVVTPGDNLLRLLDVAGLPDLRAGGPPLDVPLGPGSFSAPTASGPVVVVLELTASRLLTFTTDGTKIAEVALPPGTGAQAVQRGADGRIYVDEPGGGRLHVVQPDGSVAAVELGPGATAGAAAAPPEEQRRPVVAPRAGRAPGSVSDVSAARGGAAPGPGLPGDPGAVGGPLVPPVGEAPPEPPLDHGEGSLGNPPAAPSGVRAELTGANRITVSWQPVDGGGLPVAYNVLRSDGTGLGTTQPRLLWPDSAPGTYTFTVTATTAAGDGAPSAASNAVTIAAGVPAAPVGLTASRQNQAGLGLVFLDWTAPAASPVPVTGYQVTAKGVVRSGTYSTAELEYQDINYCSPVATYAVRSVAANGALSDPATLTLDTPADCTPETEVTSATAGADGSVTVVVDCLSAGRSTNSLVDIELLFDGQRRDNGEEPCRRSSAGREAHTFSIAGLQPATTYVVTARTTSTTGSKTSNAVQVTTNP